MKKVLLLLLLSSSNLFAQVVGTQPSPNATYNQTSNLLNPTVNSWVGTVQGQNGGFSGGNTPAFNPSTNTIIFGYTTATATQTIAINQALSGTGIQVGGYNYSWNINNDSTTGQYGTLSGQVVLRDAGGNALQTYNYNYPQQSGGFRTYSGTQWFAQDYSLSGLSNLELSFTGKDATFWAGYYGPQVRNPSLSLQYTVDPCVTNPAYSPSCPGYNNVITSSNLLPGTSGTQAYAISSALSLAGAGATIHGFNYGYTYNVAGRQCAMFDLFGFCLTGWNYSDAGVATVITDSNSNTLFSESNTHNGNNNGTSGAFSKQFRFSSSLPISTLGGFAMSPWTLGASSITNMYSEAVYTADPCVSDPLSSQSCSGYAAAYLAQQCTLNALYDPSCPGYQTAQCNINPLYAQSCPGYQAAYYAQQCTLNALYDTGCPGYQQAYYNQQCSINPLYHTGCNGYASAYKAQQCNLDGLYATDCPNYAEAYAKKNILGIDTTGTSTTTKATENKPSRTEASTTISSDGTVKTEVSKTGDSVVDSAIENKTTVTQDSTAPVQLTQPSGGNQNANTQTSSQTSQNDTRKTETKTASSTNEKQQSQQSARTESRTAKNESKSGSNESKSSGEMRQAAQQKAEQEMKKAESAATFEAQVAVQTNVIGAMSFVPGFSSYAQANVPDLLQRELQKQYGRGVVDNRNVGRKLFGASDRLHEEMVNGQYR